MAQSTQALPLSKEDFLALGENQIVYRRHLTGKQLKAMFPENRVVSGTLQTVH